MGKSILIVLTLFVLGMVLVTQIIIPFFDRRYPFFWFFRKSFTDPGPKQKPENHSFKDLQDLEKNVKQVKEQRSHLSKVTGQMDNKIREIKEDLN